MKINLIARLLKLRHRFLIDLHHWMIILLTAFGIFISSFPEVFAQEERKSIEEMLVDKGVFSPEEAASIQGRKFSKWVERMTFSGDFRLRHESFLKDPDRDRHRQRFRLRFGSEIKIGDFLVGIRLASGTGEQISTNQSFDNLFSQKQIWIDRAYLQWRATPSIALTAGRMPNPFFTIPDVVWDDDINPEGFAENLRFKISDHLALFLNLGQMVLDEDAADNNDQWLFAEQGGVQIGLAKEMQLILAGAFYNFKNATRGTFGQVAVQEGNTRVSPTDPKDPTLLNAFRVLDLIAELTVNVGGWPLTVQWDYVKNLADTTTDKDTAYQAGLRLGKASDPQTWEIAYFYKLAETDAAVADLSDSDFGDGGTNRKGHIFWLAYNPTKALQFKTKYFITQVEDESLPPGEDDINRFQVDLVMKF